ncbi:MAG: discoidin domain-containing protein [Tannerella sp.]|jgi:hypothetical protein|nr:discoidin domain-containing protein [Tannerella sp.]
MKKIIKQIAFTGSILCIVLTSCSKMNDLHDGYLANGEIVYAAKVDGVDVRPGKNRILLDIQIASQRIETVRIYWNDYLDSMDVAINNRFGLFPQVISNLEEKDYIFYLVSFDKFGNRSLPFEASGIVYGDRFQNGLSNRRVQVAYIVNGVMTLNWSGAPANAVYSELLYTDNTGRERTMQILPESTSTSLDDWKSGLKYRTLFAPDTAVIDTFTLDWITMSGLPVKDLAGDWMIEEYAKDDWSVVEHTGGQHGDMKPENSIDGNPMSTWHTNASLNFPYYIIIDFGKAVPIDGIVFQNRIDDLNGGTNWPKQVKWEAGNDLSAWTTILELNEMPNTKDELRLPCTANVSARYLKFNMYSGWRGQPYGYIGEMGIFRMK